MFILITTECIKVVTHIGMFCSIKIHHFQMDGGDDQDSWNSTDNFDITLHYKKKTYASIGQNLPLQSKVSI